MSDSGCSHSGSEDSCGYVWDKASGVLAAKLQGHSALVNAVAFSQVNEQMLISAGDDHSIRVWHSHHLVRKLSQTYACRQHPPSRSGRKKPWTCTLS